MNIKISTIEVGDLVLVQEYGDDPYWFEVLSINHANETLTCIDELGEEFEVVMGDVYGVSNSDSVLK